MLHVHRFVVQLNSVYAHIFLHKVGSRTLTYIVGFFNGDGHNLVELNGAAAYIGKHFVGYIGQRTQHQHGKEVGGSIEREFFAVAVIVAQRIAQL